MKRIIIIIIIIIIIEGDNGGGQRLRPYTHATQMRNGQARYKGGTPPPMANNYNYSS